MSDGPYEAHGVRYRVHPDVYDPSDDTFLLMGVVRSISRGSLLELGTGAGLVAIAAAHAGHRVVATDVNVQALRLARSNAERNRARIEVVRADLLRGIRADLFDALVFNAPYLPTASAERLPGALNLAFDGGPDGLGPTRRLLRHLPTDAPPLYVVASSLQPEDAWARLVRETGYSARAVARLPLPHEVLEVRRLTPTRKD